MICIVCILWMFKCFFFLFSVVGHILCDYLIHVCLCLLHCIQNEVLQLLLLCSQASDGSQQLALQWSVSTLNQRLLWNNSLTLVVFHNRNNLLSNCRLLCRLTYALCLNFLAVIHLDGHVTGAVEQVETSFTKVRFDA